MIPWFLSEISLKDKKNAYKLLVNSKSLSENILTNKFKDTLSKRLKTKYLTLTNSGSVSILMSLMALNLKTNDEVVLPNRSWISTLHAVKLLKLKPVFVDVKSNTTLIDEKLIENAITKKTKAIITVNLNGRVCNKKIINSIVRKHNLYLIEDNAQSILSTDENKKFFNKSATFSCFSFGATKLINTGQGGAILSKNKRLYEKILLIKYNGIINNNKGKWGNLGFNFKYTDMQSSFGLISLKNIDKKISKYKIVFNRYKNNLKNNKNIEIIDVNTKYEIPIYVEVIAKDRNRLIYYLKKNNIETLPFYRSLNKSPIVKKAKFISKDNNSDKFHKFGLWLPGGADIKINQIDKISKLINNFYNINY